MSRDFIAPIGLPQLPGGACGQLSRYVVGRADEPRVGVLAPPEHQAREPRGPGRVAHPRELALRARPRRSGSARGAVLERARRAQSARSSQSVSHAGSIVSPCPSFARWCTSTACARRSAARRRTASSRRRAPTTWRVKAVRELLRRNPQLPPERIDDVVFAATAQVGDQGLTLGRDVALLAGLPTTVPGFAVDRMCAGALTATTAGAGEIAMGAADVVLVGGVEHMGHHPMGADVDFNPRFVAERLDRRVAPPSWGRRPRTSTTPSRS